MSKLRRPQSTFLAVLALGAVLGYIAALSTDGPAVQADASETTMSAASVAAAALTQAEEPEVSPVEAREPRDTYYPNTEDLAPDEMRVTACGTGMPTTRAAQAAACFLVELGNGDKFLFDCGSGAAERISSLQIPYNYLDKVFIGHLHTDHFGSLHDLFIGGALMGRNVPLRVWGPSGPTEQLGTAYALDHMRKMLEWDISCRVGNVDPRGYRLEVHEFDYRGENEVIYEENGVTIRSFPAIHGIDGSVSFSLEWNDLKFVYGSDTYPNTWFAEYAQDADIAIHECFIAVPDLVTKMRFTPESALQVGTQVHTAPEAFGKVMSEVQPRIAVAYHFFNDYDTAGAVHDRIRTTYDGPLSLANDFMVWNVTKDDITVRMAVTEEHTWSPPLAAPAVAPDPNDKAKYAEMRDISVESLQFSDFTKSGFMDVDDVLRPIYQEASEAVGREFPYPGDK